MYFILSNRNRSSIKKSFTIYRDTGSQWTGVRASYSLWAASSTISRRDSSSSLPSSHSTAWRRKNKHAFQLTASRTITGKINLHSLKTIVPYRGGSHRCTRPSRTRMAASHACGPVSGKGFPAELDLIRDEFWRKEKCLVSCTDLKARSWASNWILWSKEFSLQHKLLSKQWSIYSTCGIKFDLDSLIIF